MLWRESYCQGLNECSVQKETSGALCWTGGGTSGKNVPNYSLG